MSSNSKVIDIWEHRKKLQPAEKPASNLGSKPAKTKKQTTRPSEVVDFDTHREAALNRDRRIAKRTVLSEFVGCFVVIPKVGLRRVNLHDISESGISFDVENQYGQFRVGEEVATRIYLSQKSYFPFTVKVTNLRGEITVGSIRHGAIIQAAENEEALYHFIRFVESVCESLQVDQGDRIAPARR